MPRAMMVSSVLGLVMACGSPPKVEQPVASTRAPRPAPEPASAAPAPPAPAPTRIVPPTSDLLRDGFAERFKERTLPKRQRDPRQVPVVAVHEPGKTRYVADTPAYRVLITAEDAELWETPVRVSALTRGPVTPKASGERVLVAPGLRVEREQEKNGFAFVTADDETMQVQGWLEPELLGRVYVPTYLPQVGLGEHWILAAGSKLLDAPGGRVIGQLLDTAHPQVVVTELKRTAAWYVEVAYQTPTLSVRGFVPKSALSEPQHGGYGMSYGRLNQGLTPPSEKITFPAGTCLYAEPWGEVVGVLRLPLEEQVHVESGERAAWRRLFVADTAWVWLPRAGAAETAPDGTAKSLSLADGFSCAPPPKR